MNHYQRREDKKTCYELGLGRKIRKRSTKPVGGIRAGKGRIKVEVPKIL